MNTYPLHYKIRPRAYAGLVIMPLLCFTIDLRQLLTHRSFDQLTSIIANNYINNINRLLVSFSKYHLHHSITSNN